MWTAENRARYDRSRLRYPSDLTDEEWAYVAPLILLSHGTCSRILGCIEGALLYFHAPRWVR